MKKTLLTLAAVAALAGSAFGQGQVTMANNASSLIRLFDSVSGTPVDQGTTTFQLYFGLNSGSLSPLTPTAGVNAVADGRIANTTITVGSPGTSFFFRIFAWQGAFGDYTSAANANQNVGFSTIFQAATSPDISPPPTATSLAGLYPGFALNPIPEPSTMALIGLGAASLVLFRRRKA